MQPRTVPDGPADLDAFVAANLGRILDADTGPWLGQAALAASSRDATVPVPEGWHEALNAALPPH